VPTCDSTLKLPSKTTIVKTREWRVFIYGCLLHEKANYLLLIFYIHTQHSTMYSLFRMMAEKIHNSICDFWWRNLPLFNHTLRQSRLWYQQVNRIVLMENSLVASLVALWSLLPSSVFHLISDSGAKENRVDGRVCLISFRFEAGVWNCAKRWVLKYLFMLTLGFTQTCCTELKFHADVSEVK